MLRFREIGWRKSDAHTLRLILPTRLRSREKGWWPLLYNYTIRLCTRLILAFTRSQLHKVISHAFIHLVIRVTGKSQSHRYLLHVRILFGEATQEQKCWIVNWIYTVRILMYFILWFVLHNFYQRNVTQPFSSRIWTWDYFICVFGCEGCMRCLCRSFNYLKGSHLGPKLFAHRLQCTVTLNSNFATLKTWNCFQLE